MYVRSMPALAAHLDAHAARTADRATSHEATCLMGEQISISDIDNDIHDMLFGALDAPDFMPSGELFIGMDGMPYLGVVVRADHKYAP